jgi:hypothetical protein
MTNTTNTSRFSPRARKFIETRVEAETLKVGDVFWFSGYWVTFTGFRVTERGTEVRARWPHSPEGRDGGNMFWLRTAADCAAATQGTLASSWGPSMVTVRTLNPDYVPA